LKKAQDYDFVFKQHVKSETHNWAMMRWTEFKCMFDQPTSPDGRPMQGL